MTSYAEFEIGLRRRDADFYAVELRFTQPESDADVRVTPDGPSRVEFDTGHLSRLRLDSTAYGQLLGEQLFADASVAKMFAQAEASAQSQNAPLRLRLFIDSKSPELHDLHWETLRHPDHSRSLVTSEHVLFSRYLSSQDMRPARPRPRSELRALVVIANPSNLVADYHLAPVDVPAELERIQRSLGDIAITALPSEGPATLNNLVARLRDGYDILYLVAHGALSRHEPRLWLEDDTGEAAVIAGAELVTRLEELQRRPSLVVLASCQSAGSGSDTHSNDGGALAALGPRLAEAGIPAVLGMQDNISTKTLSEFMPVFFKELQRDGHIDRATAVARGTVRERPDAWMPVLFMRLRSGRLWYVPGFADDRQDFELWPALLGNIRQGRCTPILGSGLRESLLGSTRDIAQRWAQTYHFPMAPHERDDLAQVAQYLVINQHDINFPRDQLLEYMRQEVLMEYGHQLSAELHSASLDQLIETVGKLRRTGDPAEPHQALASLPFKIFVTTNVDNLLASALKDVGKEPKVEICRWNRETEALSSIYDTEPGYQPDTQRPMVYHLFGRLTEPDSIVLTEDDHFDYLIGTAANKDLIPHTVRRSLSDSALLILGFQLDDWSFRVLFRSLLGQEGSGRRRRYSHVAAQINPDDSRFLDPERARRYLEGYFRTAEITIYWGSAEDFVKDLLARWEPNTDAETSAPLVGRPT
jgi:hypothetical protein